MLVTSIDARNRQAFAGCMPDDLLRALSRPGVYGLGLLADVGETEKEVAGVLVFSVEQGSAGPETLIAATIQWLYVPPPYRGRQAADRLMETFWQIMDDSGIENIVCDVPLPAEYNPLCAYLESWGFQFSLIDRYDLTVSLRELRAVPALQGAPRGRIVPLSQADPAAFARFLDRAAALPGALQELPRTLSAYEPNLSCLLPGGGQIDGALLVQPAADDTLSLVLLRTLSQPQHMGDLCRFALRAAAQYPPDTQVRISCRLESAGALLDKLLPQAQPLLVRRGYYDNSAPSDDAPAP